MWIQQSVVFNLAVVVVGVFFFFFLILKYKNVEI